MVNIFTGDFFLAGKAKNFLKGVFGVETRGPKGVFDSLARGLKVLGEPFRANQRIVSPVGSVVVLSGHKTLAWAIKQKKRGLVGKIIAGPNIVVTPFDHRGIIQDPAVDVIILPSAWVGNWWSSLVPALKKRIRIWPAGVRDIYEPKKERQKILVFQKNGNPEVLAAVKDFLYGHNLPFEVIAYGQFSQSGYYQQLTESKALIYLSESESQGLSLAEAWMADVPTLVWNRGYMKYKQYSWSDAQISAPYLAPQAGMFFTGTEDLPEVFRKFSQTLNSFTPRQYALDNFSDKVCAKKFLEIVNN